MRGRGLGFVRSGGGGYEPPRAPPSTGGSFSSGDYSSRLDTHLNNARSRFGGRARDYFDDDDDDEPAPAPARPAGEVDPLDAFMAGVAAPAAAPAAAAAEPDPLDAFMEGVEASSSADAAASRAPAKAEFRRFAKQAAGEGAAAGAAKEKPAFLDEAEDPLDDYVAAAAKRARRGDDDDDGGGAGDDDDDDDDDNLEYDANGQVIGKAGKKRIEPLARVDHGTITCGGKLARRAFPLLDCSRA